MHAIEPTSSLDYYLPSHAQALDIASRPKISGLGLSPVCDATLELICDASAPWSPRTHYTFPDAHRPVVKLLLLIANRHLVEGYKGYCTTAMVRGEVVAVPLALPVELWTDWILPFLGRDTLLLAPFPDLCEYCGAGARGEALPVPRVPRCVLLRG